MTTEYYVEGILYTSLSDLLSDGWPDDAVVQTTYGSAESEVTLAELREQANRAGVQGQAVNADLERDTAVLARHWRIGVGMTSGSPDYCACGAQTRPAPGDADVSDRRALAFAAHQAAMLAEARKVDQ